MVSLLERTRGCPTYKLLKSDAIPKVETKYMILIFDLR